jgi:hypothetical protein
MTDDFAPTLAKIQDYGILDESPDDIRDRLILALHGVAAVEGGQSIELGAGDWAVGLIKQFESALRLELCDPNQKLLKEEYRKIFQETLTPTGVAAVSGIVLKVVAVINPAFAVPTVGIYMSIWLMKVGLNYWCSIEQK